MGKETLSNKDLYLSALGNNNNNNNKLLYFITLLKNSCVLIIVAIKKFISQILPEK